MIKGSIIGISLVCLLGLLQSCVTNYVVSSPSSSYKPEVKLAKISPKSLNQAKKKLSDSKQIDEVLASVDKIPQVEKDPQQSYLKQKINDLLAEAETYIGTPYRYGGMSRAGIDCSAFVLSVFGNVLGINLPRVAASQAKEGEKVSKEELKKGDLVFFSHGRRISHVGIVHDIDANGLIHFIHAATSRGVMISSLSNTYWGPKFRFAKRIINPSFVSNIQAMQ